MVKKDAVDKKNETKAEAKDGKSEKHKHSSDIRVPHQFHLYL